jgi:hypothetical protein
MMVILLVLVIVGVAFLGVIIAVDLHHLSIDHASSRAERSRINLETVRAERQLHRIASDAFVSMMEVTRLRDETGEPEQPKRDGDDAE